MFDILTERLNQAMNKLRGKGRLTEDAIRTSLREIRITLLEADVALPVVQAFIGQVRERALGVEVLKSLTPGQAMVKVVHQELVQIMGRESRSLDLNASPPVIVLLAGLQGSGKTTSCAKLARLLVREQRKKVMMVSCDVYRPAALEQLETLAGQVGAEYVSPAPLQKPVQIAVDAVAAARRRFMDVLLVDTAGRLHVDEEMMDEIRAIHAAIEPKETLFVVDAMTGQDAANTARAFGEAVSLTGIVLTKADGDARGGAALSVRHITGKPIKFIGTGEKTDALDPFHPERIASRILGMGDVLSLVEEVQRTVDKEKAEKLARKLRTGKGFSMADFRNQLEQMQTMGGIGGLLDKLPGQGGMSQSLKDRVDDRHTRHTIAIINSMTLQERQFPDVIRGSRKKRIAAGSGTTIQDVNRVLKQFGQMRRMMKKFGRGGMHKMMRQLGRMPPGGIGA